jgi:hypothetical protein
MGLNRASTLNLNIRYGKLALDMMGQAATYGLRSKLKGPYQTWNAEHLGREVLAWADGDIRVKYDTIVVTFYGTPDHLDPEPLHEPARYSPGRRHRSTYPLAVQF